MDGTNFFGENKMETRLRGLKKKIADPVAVHEKVLFD